MHESWCHGHGFAWPCAGNQAAWPRKAVAMAPNNPQNACLFPRGRLLLAHSQEPRARFEETPATLLSPAWRLFLERLQIRQIGQAKSATHDLQVEFNVVVLAAIKYLQEIIAPGGRGLDRSSDCGGLRWPRCCARPDRRSCIMLRNCSRRTSDWRSACSTWAVSPSLRASSRYADSLLTRKGRHADIP